MKAGERTRGGKRGGSIWPQLFLKGKGSSQKDHIEKTKIKRGFRYHHPLTKTGRQRKRLRGQGKGKKSQQERGKSGNFAKGDCKTSSKSLKKKKKGPFKEEEVEKLEAPVAASEKTVRVLLGQRNRALGKTAGKRGRNYNTPTNKKRAAQGGDSRCFRIEGGKSIVSTAKRGVTIEIIDQNWLEGGGEAIHTYWREGE